MLADNDSEARSALHFAGKNRLEKPVKFEGVNVYAIGGREGMGLHAAPRQRKHA